MKTNQVIQQNEVNIKLSKEFLKIQRRKRFKQNIPLIIMFTPIILYYLIFKYIPMGGLIIAFKDYNFADGMLGSPWVGLKQFRLLFGSPQTLNIIRNTFVLSIIKLVVGFPVPIILALLLNEVHKKWFKKTVQTIVYLPHFFSWVIIGGMVATIFSQNSSFINSIIAKINGQPFPFMYKPLSWISIFVGTGIWKESGFGTIIYLAALTSVDANLYEAAAIDGANKWKQTLNITIPAIIPTIAIVFILQIGSVMSIGFEPIFVLQNPAVYEVSDVISTYIYRIGLLGGRFSITTAMGLFDSLVGLVLVVSANRIARKFGQELW